MSILLPVAEIDSAKWDDVQTMIGCHCAKNPDPELRIVSHEECTSGKSNEEEDDQLEQINYWLSNDGSFKQKGKPKAPPKRKPTPREVAIASPKRRKQPQSRPRTPTAVHRPRPNSRTSPRFAKGNKRGSLKRLDLDGSSSDDDSESTSRLERVRRRRPPKKAAVADGNNSDGTSTVGVQEENKDGSGEAVIFGDCLSLSCLLMLWWSLNPPCWGALWPHTMSPRVER